MGRCGSDTQHIVVNAAAPGSAPTMLPSAATVMARLNVLAPSVFPLLPPTPAAGTCILNRISLFGKIRLGS